MSIPLLIEERDIQIAIGAQRADQLLGHKGTGRADPSVVRALLQDASDEAARFLAPGFTPEEIVELIRSDGSLRRKVAFLAVGMGGMGRSEFTDANGNFAYTKPYEEARKDLMAVGSKDQRSAAEQQRGIINRMTGPRVGLRRNRAERRFIFADTRYHRGGGPF